MTFPARLRELIAEYNAAKQSQVRNDIADDIHELLWQHSDALADLVEAAKHFNNFTTSTLRTDGEVTVSAKHFSYLQEALAAIERSET